jgi:hypothetical protein
VLGKIQSMDSNPNPKAEIHGLKSKIQSKGGLDWIALFLKKVHPSVEEFFF